MSNVPPSPRRYDRPHRLKDAAEIRKERLEQRKRLQRKNAIQNVATGVAVALLVVSGIALIVGIGALVFYLAWNLGVVPIVAAAGASVGKIGFWTALGGSLAVGVVKGIFHGGSSATVTKK